MALENQEAQHYAHGTLEREIMAALAASGKSSDRLSPADLAPVDEFRIGGRAATIELAGQMGVRAASNSSTSDAVSTARRAISRPSWVAASSASI